MKKFWLWLCPYLTGINGQKSAKRLWASILLGVAIGDGITISVLGVFLDLRHDPMLTHVFNGFLWGGLGLLGVGVAEGFARLGKNAKS